MKNKSVRLRCWVEVDDARFFGPGPAELLEEIDKEGSIARAAKKIGMSYKKAWDIIENLNSNSKNQYVQSFKGGSKGGRAEVTAHGHKVLAAYRNLNNRLTSVLQKDQELIQLI